MRRLIICLFTISGFYGRSQMTAGLTGRPDTSYTTYSAYLRDVKTHPDIEIVREFSLPSVRARKDIVYCREGERPLLLDVFCAARKTNIKRPAIMIIHGGGWRTGNRTQHYPLAQQLAALGYVCFTPEYRLSTEALYPAAVYDLKAAIKWIRGHARDFKVDTSKIVVLGFSAGGELAAFLGTTGDNPAFDDQHCNMGHSTRVQAIVDLDGILSFIHPESGEGDDTRSVSSATYWFGYPKKEKPKLWEDASPLTHADNHTPPTLFINSAVARMHAGRDDFRKVLDRYGIYSEMHAFEDAPHSFPLYNPWFTPTVQYIDSFLRKIFSYH